ncbi:MAG: M28 family peptidase, partial [Bacteroidota bacterium]
MKLFKSVIVFACVISCLHTTAQNAIPVISNITALADTVFHKLNITFNVTEAENENLEIFLGVSADSGISYPYNTANATGHIGFPVSAGSNRHIEWYYPDSLSAMLPRLSVKLTANDRYAIDIQQIVNQIDTARLRQNLQFIEGIRHRLTDSTHLKIVQDSIYKAFQRYGLQARKHDVLFNSAYTGKNIIGRKPGAVNDTRTYIFDGHYDTVDDSPGADDNGSAIAAMLEVLRVISPLPLQNTIEFIGFDLEEAGLVGSETFVQNGIQSYENIAGVINADMIGYYSTVPYSQTIPAGFDLIFPALYSRLVADSFRANFIISSANDSSVGLLSLFESMAAQYVPGLLVGSIQIPG